MSNMFPCVIMFQSLNGKYYVSVVEDVSIYEGVSMGVVERLIRNSDPKIYDDEYTCWVESWKLHGKMGNVGVPKRLMPVLIHGDGRTNVDELIIMIGVIDMCAYKGEFMAPPLSLHRCYGNHCSICNLKVSFGNKCILKKGMGSVARENNLACL